MADKIMNADFLADIKPIVEDASKHISKSKKQLRDDISGNNSVICGELTNYYVFESSFSKGKIPLIFQLYVIPKIEESIRDLLYWNYPHIQSPKHRQECFHFWGDFPISYEKAEEMWK